jgi:hypothetical protein
MNGAAKAIEKSHLPMLLCNGKHLGRGYVQAIRGICTQQRFMSHLMAGAPGFLTGLLVKFMAEF